MYGRNTHTGNFYCTGDLILLLHRFPQRAHPASSGTISTVLLGYFPDPNPRFARS